MLEKWITAYENRLNKILDDVYQGKMPDKDLVAGFADDSKNLLRFYKKQTSFETENWVGSLSEKFNSFDLNKDGCRNRAKALVREHRTLQQNFMRFVVQYIKAKAGSDYCDCRDKATFELCRKLETQITEADEMLPFV